MSMSEGFSGVHLDLMDGRADLPRAGAVVRDSAPSLQYVVIDAAGREVEPASGYLRGTALLVIAASIPLIRDAADRRAQQRRMSIRTQLA